MMIVKTTIILLSIYGLMNEIYGEKPNIVLIVADDLGWNDVGYHGSNQIPTPNIDALAYSGTILHNYYTLPLCTPSRSALMTGMLPINIGMQHNVIYAPEPWGLPLEQKILPQYLKDEGYVTHAVGKWHLGFFKSVYTPTKRGFDSHFGYWTGRHDYFNHTADVKNMIGYDMRRGLNASWESINHYTTDLITEETVKRIHEHNKTSPLFLYVGQLACHSALYPEYLQAPKEILDKFKYITNAERRKYAAMLWKLDDSVGKIVSSLGERKMLDNTIIIFTTDNGGAAAGFNHNAASNWPLRGVKDTLFEGGVRGVAFIWGKRLPSSNIYNGLFHIKDWLPTILGAINVSETISNISKMDGKNIWPALLEKNNSIIYDEILLNNDQLRNISALRKGDWKIISGDPYSGRWNNWFGPNGRDLNYTYDYKAINSSFVVNSFRKNEIFIPTLEIMQGLRKNVSLECNKRKQMIETCSPKVSTCLFNINDDPCEYYNLAEVNVDKLKELQSILLKYKPIKARNQPLDQRSNPVNWNGTWNNWMDYISQ